MCVCNDECGRVITLLNTMLFLRHIKSFRYTTRRASPQRLLVYMYKQLYRWFYAIRCPWNRTNEPDSHSQKRVQIIIRIVVTGCLNPAKEKNPEKIYPLARIAPFKIRRHQIKNEHRKCCRHSLYGHNKKLTKIQNDLSEYNLCIDGTTSIYQNETMVDRSI